MMQCKVQNTVSKNTQLFLSMSFIICFFLDLNLSRITIATAEYIFLQFFLSQASSSADRAFGKAGLMLSQSQLLPEQKTVGFAKSWHIAAQLINQALRTSEKSINVSSDSYFLSSGYMAACFPSTCKRSLLGTVDKSKVERERCFYVFGGGGRGGGMLLCTRLPE